MAYALITSVAALVWPLLFRWRRYGTEHVPPRGAALVCANHRAWADPVAIAIACRRRVHFMAKAELFRFAPVAFCLRLLAAFPVHRGRPDRAALRHGFRLLDEGQVVGMFPEGTRSRTGRLGPPEPGAALFAARSGASIVPAAIAGDYRLRRPLTVRFGPPFTLDPPPGGRITAAWLAGQSEVIMDRIRQLLEDAHGVATD